MRKVFAVLSSFRRRQYLPIIACVSLAVSVQAQTIGTCISDDGALANANAMLDVRSPATGDGKGALIPRITENQRTNANSALAGGLLDDSGDLRGGAAQGLMIYQTDGQQGLYYNTSSTATPTWVMPGSGAGDFMADGTVAMTGNLNMGGQSLTNVSGMIFALDNTAIGAQANGVTSGVAVGASANANGYGAAVGSFANGSGSGAAVGRLARAFSSGAAIGQQSYGTNSGAAVGSFANGSDSGAAVGSSAKGYSLGAAVGFNANAINRGVAVGQNANGANTNVAIGSAASANGGVHRIAIGESVNNAVDESAALRGTLYLDGGTNVMIRSTFGSGAWTPLVGAAGDFMANGTVAMTGNLNMGSRNIINVASNIAFSGDEIIIGKNATADYGYDGVAIGSAAHGDYQGVGVGYQANGAFGGVALGYQVNAFYYGVAVGYQARARTNGAAVGQNANAITLGAALGSSANGYQQGAAVGVNANGRLQGAALGYYANATEGGVAIGIGANGITTNIAIGMNANAWQNWGNKRIAIGQNTTNYVDNSAVIRGTLYLDGGTGVLYRSSFGSGGWTALGGGSAIASLGYVYDLTVGGQVVAGGADVTFANNGPLSGVTHTGGTSALTVPNTGTYKIEYSISITAGIGAQMALAVNGTVDASTCVDILVGIGNISGTAMLVLSAGDVITIRNNSATPFTTTASPGVGAQITITQLN